MKKSIITLLFSSLLFACTQKYSDASYKVIPLPQQISLKKTERSFTMNSATRIFFKDLALKGIANQFSTTVKHNANLNLQVEQGDKKEGANVVIFELGLKHTHKEAYQINIDSSEIHIQSVTPSGAFYAMQTLVKSIPVQEVSEVHFPATEIKDYPRFAYRGMMLDVSRHFSDVEMVKRTIDILALHNLNVFHWHLTDDQGWRMEIKKRPLLTQIGAWRDNTVVGRYIGGNDYPTDNQRHGGFYTQDQIKDVIAYAAERYITIIPEIDLPGHTSAVLASYPELGCIEKEYKVANRWGVIKDVICAGNEQSLQLFKDVMDEVCELFPGKYIHIGGDECVKERWQACSKCQGKIKQLHLKSDSRFSKEDYLQSYFMGEIAQYLHSKGKQVIGWDEILEGMPMDDSVIMSWRGISGGIEAARLNHDVIMAPATHMYFDYSQTLDSSKEEIPVGGYINVERVYSFEPLPEGLTDNEKKHIIGVQANVWCEYMPNERIRQYQILPRLAALSEVQWTMPEKKNYLDFLSRLPQIIDIYDLYGYNYARHILDVSITDKVDIKNRDLEVSLSTLGNDSIFYTLDGSLPDRNSYLYKGVLKIDSSVTLKAMAYRNNQMSQVSSLKVDCNKATFKPVTLHSELSRMHVYGGASMLVDGIIGSTRPDDARWLGFPKGFEAVIDLRQQTSISKLLFTNLSVISDNILDPDLISVFVSDDGKYYQCVKEERIIAKQGKEASVSQHQLDFESTKARFVKIQANASVSKASTLVPWMFVSEIGIQ